MRSPLRRRAAVGALVVAAALFLGACGNAKLSLSLKPGVVSDCYRGLPTARAALHDNTAKLEGVHRVTLHSVLRFLPGVTAPGTSLPEKPSVTEVCTFAFRGHFMPRQVTGAPPTAEGHVAIVVVSSSNLQLLAAYVGEGLPHRFSHRVAGPRLVVDSPRPNASPPTGSPHRQAPPLTTGVNAT